MALQAEVAVLLDRYYGREAALRTDDAVAVPAEPVFAVAERPVGPHGIPVRTYVPGEGTGRPIIVYLHGGGWVTGDLDMHDGTCRRLANLAGAVVVNVGYRLAPAYPFPVPLDDCFEALRWASESAADLGADSARLAVAGSSAGGNLAAAVALRAREEGGPRIALQILLYPVIDSRMATESYRTNGTGYLLEKEAMASYWHQYVANPADMSHPYASPAHASDLAGLAPALIVTAEYDPLRDEGEAYATRLRQAGVPVRCIRYRGQIHGFLAVGPGLADSGDVVHEVGAAVTEVSSGYPLATSPRWSTTEVRGSQ
jgi:acetyl esterase